MTDVSAEGGISENFNAADSDVTFQSSDHILFRLHRKNLEAHAAGFAPPGFETNGEIVQLTEVSSTLELLFQFIYPVLQPDVESMDFEDFALLAEASEKYQVFSAISICRFRMKTTLPDHAHEVMSYAVRHGCNNIIHMAAPILISAPPHITIKKLSPNIMLPWVLYYNKWNKVLRKAVSFKPSRNQVEKITEFHSNSRIRYNMRKCSVCSISVDDLIPGIVLRMDSVKSLRNLYTVFEVEHSCTHMQEMIREWQGAIEQDIRSIESFTTFL